MEAVFNAYEPSFEGTRSLPFKGKILEGSCFLAGPISRIKNMLYLNDFI
jgi:hypothetical protein